MIQHIGHVCEVVRYPVKSMAGVITDSAFLGWHGLAGDRRFAFRRLEDASGFPWLTASRLHELILYQPIGAGQTTGEPLPTHVRTPGGIELDLRGDELTKEIAERFGRPVQLMELKNGIFDDASISVISRATIAAISSQAEVPIDTRRFRANIVVEMANPEPFAEDEWMGGTLLFGESEPHAAVSVTTRDVRCVMINLDPGTAEANARLLKSAVQLNANNAGIYGTVVQTGRIHVGQPVSLVQSRA